MKILTKLSIVCSLLLIAATLILCISSPERRGKNAFFSYETKGADDYFVHVDSGRVQDIPFSFLIDQGLATVRLQIADMPEAAGGISLLDNQVMVKGGYATGLARFSFAPGNSLRPGTHYVKIVAKNPIAGEVLRTGEVPFILDMAEIIAKCSC